MTREEFESLGFVAITPETFPFDECTVQSAHESGVIEAPKDLIMVRKDAYEVVLAVGNDMDNSPFDFIGIPFDIEIRTCHPYKFTVEADGENFPEPELVGAWTDVYRDVFYHSYAFKFGRIVYSNEYKALMFRKVKK